MIAEGLTRAGTAARRGRRGRGLREGRPQHRPRRHVLAGGFAVLKNFELGERAKLQFRTEFFNVLNHTNFLLPSTNYSTADARGNCTLGSFGTITGTLDPRLVQFGLKLNF